jgi:chromosome segregation and condensation protein ScpB
MINFYLKYLQFVSSNELHQHKQESMSPTAIFLLNMVAIRDFEKKPMTVTQAMTIQALGSASNLHRKLDELREAGMIEVKSVGSNRRTKYLFITQTAYDYFQIKSEAMMKAIDKPSQAEIQKTLSSGVA